MMQHTPPATLNQLWKKGTDFLGSTYAILGGAMTWVSDHSLVSAISNAGGFGVLASGAMPPEIFSQEIDKTKALTKNPFGVNLITMNPRIFDLIDVCQKHRISHVVLAGGLPSDDMIQAIKKNGAKVIAFAPSATFGKKLVRLGVDALIIEGHEAGGHIGPISTSVLAQEILPVIQNVPVFVAGGIGSGAMIGSYLLMGAAGCQLGTRFVCAHESRAHPAFKQAFINANARDAIPSVQIDPRFPVIPVRAIINHAAKEFMRAQAAVIAKCDAGELDMKEAQLTIEHFWAGALRKAVVDGDIDNGSLMAGQSVGMVHKEQPTKEIIEELVQESLVFLKKISHPMAQAAQG